MLLTFHLQKWQNVTHETICSYLQCSHNESWQAPVLLFTSCYFLAQHDCCTHTHKLKQTQSRRTIPFERFPGVWILFAAISEHPVCPFFPLTPPVKTEHTVTRNVGKYNSEAGKKPPKKRMQHSEHGESLKSRKTVSFSPSSYNLNSTRKAINYSQYILPMSETAQYIV
jgi:hypothetical protein